MRRSRQLALIVSTILPLGAYLACGDDEASSGTTPTDQPDSSIVVGHQPDGAPIIEPGDEDGGNEIVTNDGGLVVSAAIDFDPDGDGDPTSLIWDDANSALWIADNRHNQIWKWTDAEGFFKYDTFPNAAPPDAATDIGQIAQLKDGTLVVPRFGFGLHGGIEFVNPSTQAGGEVPGTDPTKRRVGLWPTGDGTSMYGTYFRAANSMDDAGTVTLITEQGETDYAGGFQKPVAVLVIGQQLFVSDQNRGLLYVLPTDGGAVPPYATFSNIASPDTIVAGPNGTIISGQFRVLADGGSLQVRQISADGQSVKVIFGETTFVKPKGLAYDKTNKRLFVADSNGTTIRKLRIFPLQ